MVDKFQETYEDMFSALAGNCLISKPKNNSKYICPLYIFKFRPTFKMMSDWELAERQAFSLWFDMILLGCLFHLGKSFLTNHLTSTSL